MAHPKAGYASLESLVRSGIIFALQDAFRDIIDVTLEPLLHCCRGVPLALRLGTILADDGATVDFDLGDRVVGLGGVVEHDVYEVLLVAKRHVSTHSHSFRQMG